ncbi:CLUMA_CG010139, isoform A [Clunio marinus]|uniref:CLUMA_CG010139, isoform A n=1 Tax=Clunio marinus TaxID=568069 RepID=A0A1J1I926_9DIPT|nr:CLUMA_CG010139, isoform A [Clunio marinus]
MAENKTIVISDDLKLQSLLNLTMTLLQDFTNKNSTLFNEAIKTKLFVHCDQKGRQKAKQETIFGIMNH